MNDITLRQAASIGQQMFKAGRGIVQFLKRGQADQTAWHALLNLHCRTNGRSTDVLTWIMRHLRPPARPLAPFDSMLGHFEVEAVEAIATKIREDGYYVFENLMPSDLCEAFTAACMMIEGRVSRAPDDRRPKARFDPNHPIGYVYDLPEADVWKFRSAQKLIADPVFLNVAQSYFKAAPALKDVNVWWSAVLGGRADSHSAQLFHFDYDPAPIWLKFFVYMTDVTADSGPHVYVRGSHRMQQPKMREMLSRGYVRIADHEIADVFGRENIVELTGQKGTVFAVDTLGYHKGKAPQTGHRLLAQLEFATPLFANSVSSPIAIPTDLDPALVETLETYSWAFRRYHREP